MFSDDQRGQNKKNPERLVLDEHLLKIGYTINRTVVETH